MGEQCENQWMLGPFDAAGIDTSALMATTTAPPELLQTLTFPAPSCYGPCEPSNVLLRYLYSPLICSPSDPQYPFGLYAQLLNPWRRSPCQRVYESLAVYLPPLLGSSCVVQLLFAVSSSVSTPYGPIILSDSSSLSIHAYYDPPCL